MQFVDKHLERFRNTRLRDVLSLDDGFVCLNAADDIVGLDGQDFLQGVSRTVSFESPNFHFAETLAAELGFTAERLLGDEGVRTGRTGVNLIIDQGDAA